jgi:transcriptional regulator with XRE-family HTH domain
MSIAKRLKNIRKSLGKNQEEMAASLGISYPSWQGYEQGKNIPGGVVIEALVKKGFNANWILTGNGTMRIEIVRLQEKDFDFKTIPLYISALGAYQDKFNKKFSHEKQTCLLYTLFYILSEQESEWQTEKNATQILEALLRISNEFDIFRKLNMGHNSTLALISFLENPDSLGMEKQNDHEESQKKVPTSKTTRKVRKK